jgi:hypothetical protein
MPAAAAYDWLFPFCFSAGDDVGGEWSWSVSCTSIQSDGEKISFRLGGEGGAVAVALEDVMAVVCVLMLVGAVMLVLVLVLVLALALALVLVGMRVVRIVPGDGTTSDQPSGTPSPSNTTTVVSITSPLPLVIELFIIRATSVAAPTHNRAPVPQNKDIKK